MAEHYFTKKPTSRLDTSTINCQLRGNTLTLTTASGVFSKTKIDKGSEVLITYAEIKGDEKVLDLGCGYGPVGIALKRAYPNLDVTCSDINERAVMFAKKNARQNNVNIKCIVSDGFTKIKDSFEVILLNPPQTAGKKVCLDLINQAFEHIGSGGCLQIVARHQKGGKSLSEYMEELFGNMRVVKRKSGYRVYLSVKA